MRYVLVAVLWLIATPFILASLALVGYVLGPWPTVTAVFLVLCFAAWLWLRRRSSVTAPSLEGSDRYSTSGGLL